MYYTLSPDFCAQSTEMSTDATIYEDIGLKAEVLPIILTTGFIFAHVD